MAQQERICFYLEQKPGSGLTPYTSGTMIGCGGFGQVFIATNAAKHKVVVKRMEKVKPRTKKTFEIEIQASKKLTQCRGVPRVLAKYEDLQYYYMVQEYAPGCDLFELLSNRSMEPLPESQVKDIISKVARSLKEIHQAGIAHLDIKLENIMFDPSTSAVKLIDFGLSINITSPKNTKLSKQYVGSEEYCCPEILLRKPFNPVKADVFSLGVVMFALMYGAFPFHPKDRKELLKKKMKQPDISFPGPCSFEAYELAMRMLATDPHRRPTVDQIIAHPFLLSYDYQ